MSTNQKLLIVILILVTIAYVKYAFFMPEKSVQQELPKVEELEPKDENEAENQGNKIQVDYINIFFIGRNDNGDEFYKAVKRPYSEENDGQKLSYVVAKLIEGPTSAEKQKGVYSEIPDGTKVISVVETGQKAIINLSSNFEYGGGTDSLYKRLYQLVKTVNMNTDVPVYLYINNKQAEVIGGEGLMIKQPLNERIFND